ncbi:PAS domain S-box-containing protein [Cnuella takakiae]|uniref:PAS domain S-box-containing protein n=1 Tax=Cnuella takakiae TaxID=1302690 RepID=A0A1M4SRS4_9BACT|nr:PAS domain-containing protein [Cnuella takakiae]OLY90579.1 hypothetical protein BUE76_00640 [Cnuella takakiae]SHE34963.1 PAS domain S-box-containing protein [Cnuella takakiae]
MTVDLKLINKPNLDTGVHPMIAGLLHAHPYPIIGVDKGGRAVFFNEAAKRILPLPNECRPRPYRQVERMLLASLWVDAEPEVLPWQDAQGLRLGTFYTYRLKAVPVINEVLHHFESSAILLDHQFRLLAHYPGNGAAALFFDTQAKAGSALRGLVPATEFGALYQRCCQCVQGLPVVYEVSAAGQQDTNLQLKFLPINIPEAQTPGILILVADYTNTRQQLQKQLLAQQIAEALSQSSEGFEAFMEQSPSMAWISDPQGCFQYFNRAQQQKLGTTQYLIGQPYEALFTPETAETCRSTLQEVLRTGTPAVTLQKALLTNGRIDTFRVVHFPIKVAGTMMVGCWATNITRELANQSKGLRMAAAQQRTLLRSVADAQERERNYLSHWLRDSVNQTLAACKLMLEMEGGGANSLQLKAQNLLQSSIATIKEKSEMLNGNIVRELGLIPAINSLCCNFPPVVAVSNRLTERQVQRWPRTFSLGSYRCIQAAGRLLQTIPVAEALQFELYCFRRHLIVNIHIGPNEALLDVLAQESFNDLANWAAYLGGKVSFPDDTIRLSIPVVKK